MPNEKRNPPTAAAVPSAQAGPAAEPPIFNDMEIFRVSEIAERLKTSADSVTRALEKYAIPVIYMGGKKVMGRDINEMIRLCNHGLSLERIILQASVLMGTFLMHAERELKKVNTADAHVYYGRLREEINAAIFEMRGWAVEPLSTRRVNWGPSERQKAMAAKEDA